MILVARERIGPLARVVDHHPALLVAMFFLQFWMEVGGSQRYLERLGLAPPVRNRKFAAISRKENRLA